MTDNAYNIDAAKQIGSYEPNTKEWHDLRRGKIGGSMVGTIAGLNKWESAVTAFYKLTGEIDDQVPDNPAMEWGRRLESVIIDKFIDEHPELEVLKDVGTWVNKERTYQLANPDALIRRDGELGVLEIKTAAYKDDWIDENGELRVPLYYQTQVQWYLSCLDLKFAYVAVLFSGREYLEFEIAADPFQQEIDNELVLNFLNFVHLNIQPDWDGSNSTYETMRRVHPEIQDTEVELGSLGQELLEAAKEAEIATERFTKLKSEVFARMSTAKTGLVDGKPRFYRRSRSGGLPFLVIK